MNVRRLDTYVLRYVAEDDSGNRPATLVRTVVVSDEQPLAFNIIGDAVVFVEAGTLYKDPGLERVDNADGVLQAQVVGVVDTAKVGSYALTYTAKDSSGNQSSALVRNVIVRDTQAAGGGTQWLE